MPNTSASGGYLVPDATTPPLEGLALEKFIRSVMVQICGLPDASVRVRWPLEPGNLPAVGTDWAAMGILRIRPDTYSVGFQNEDESQEFQRQETIEFITSFFGPQADAYAAQLRDGLQLDQNREALISAGMELVETGEPILAPNLVKGQYLRQIDMMLMITRVVVRTYPIQTVEFANGELDNEHYLTPINVTE